MKKKISRIQRWLDRLSTACETGRWDSALVEADCLSAEVREIREDLTLKLENDHAAARGILSRSAVTMSIKSVGIALFIVMVSTLPLAVESERPRTAQNVSKPAQSNGEEILTWVTREEEELIRTLRADLSGQNAGSAKTEKVFSVPVKKRTAAEAKKENAMVSEMPFALNTQVRSETLISPEDLLALLQIGEKALRGDAPAIKVIK
jgi:hypothetical protein